jgi:hypothetical protein
LLHTEADPEPEFVEDPEKDLDLQLQEDHEADRRLIEVYGDTIHRNDGRHLDGGIEDDVAMCYLYDRVVSHQHSLYSPPQGKVGNAFLDTFRKELRMVRARLSNSERVMIFPVCILRREPGIVKAAAIRRRIMRRLELWDGGHIAELVQDVVSNAQQGFSGRNKDSSEDNIARRFNTMVHDGKIRAGVRMLTNRDGGGVLAPGDSDTKSGRPVLEVLREKHPDIRVPDLDREDWHSFETYPECANTIPVDCDTDIVQRVASRLRGGAGPSGVDALALKHWLLRHGQASHLLREELASWTEWLSNGSPPFAAYRALMSC